MTAVPCPLQFRQVPRRLCLSLAGVRDVAGPGGRTGPLPRRRSRCRPPGRTRRPPLWPMGRTDRRSTSDRGRPRPGVGRFRSWAGL